MKKLFLAGALALMGAVAVNAQTAGNFKLGAHIGMPLGDLKDVAGFNFGVDVAYLYPVSSEFKIGATTGYSYFTGKEHTFNVAGNSITQKSEGTGIIPLAAVLQYNVVPEFYLGTDLGVAFSTEKDGGSAFYYQPKVGYEFGQSDVYLGYKGWSKDGFNASTIALGYGYKF